MTLFQLRVDSLEALTGACKRKLRWVWVEMYLPTMDAYMYMQAHTHTQADPPYILTSDAFLHTETLSSKGQHCFGAVGSNDVGKWAVQVRGQHID